MFSLNSNTNLHVVLAQLNVKFGDPEGNFQHIEEKLRDINFTQKKNLIVLPELFATGYNLDAIKKHADTLDNSQIAKFVKKLAKEKHSYVYGSIPELDGENVYNTGLFIDPEGIILASYRKIHLFRPLQEHIAFLPGKDITTYNSEFGNIGFSICYDLRFAELYVHQRNEGSKIFLLCAEWPIPRINHWRTLIQARAIEHQALIVALNRTGEDPTGLYGGNSIVVAPDGEVLCQGNEQESILECSIDVKEKSSMPFLFNIKDEKRLS